MLAIMINSHREKIRSKTIYIIGGIGVLIITFLMLNADFTYDNRKLISFEELVPIGIIMINFIGSLLSVMLSLQTIPNEFERKTTHLVLTRGIKPWQYMLALTLSNILISLLSLFILSISLIIFCAAHGKILYSLNIFGGIYLIGINISLLSAITSLLSIKLPFFINGILGISIYFLGVFHNILYTLSKTLGGVFGKVLSTLLLIIPNFNAVQSEAARLVSGKLIQFHPIITQLLFLYIVITLILFTFRREV